MKIEAQLTIRVTYETEPLCEEDVMCAHKQILETLHDAAQHLDDEGLLSRYMDNTTVEEYTSEVKIDDEINYNISKQIRGRFSPI